MSLHDNNGIKHFSNVFDLLHDGVVVIDKNSRIVFANAACHRVFNYDDGALTGKPLNHLIPASFHKQHHNHISAYMNDTKPRLMGDRSVLFGINSLGEEVPVTISISSFFYEKQYYFAVIRDGALINLQHETEKARAETDSLTGLGNRSYLSNRFIELIKKPDQHFAVLFIDLNKFKPINDQYGHEAGDHALQIVAKRLSTTLRNNDIIVRIGGDEFVVLLQNIDNKNQIKIIVKKIIDSISLPIHAQNTVFSIEASIGCALYPADGTAEKELLNKADSAMYHSKSNNSGFAFHNEIS